MEDQASQKSIHSPNLQANFASEKGFMSTGSRQTVTDGMVGSLLSGVSGATGNMAKQAEKKIVRDPTKPLSPQLDKKGNLVSANDLSYIKKVKQALLERNEKNGVNEENITPNTLKATDQLFDLFNLKKLKTPSPSSNNAGKNLFVNNAIFSNGTQEFKNDATPATRGTASPPRAIGKMSTVKQLLGNLAFGGTLGNEATGSPQINFGQVLKEQKRQKSKEHDVSSSSMNSRDKSTSVSRISKTRTPMQQQGIEELTQAMKLTSSPFSNEILADLANQSLKEDKNDTLEYFSVQDIKSHRMKMLANSEDLVFKIYLMISQNKDPYETIRAYSDSSQDQQFNMVENMFPNSDARVLFSKLLKLERWMVVYLFYYTVQDNSFQQFKVEMLELAELLNRNASFVTNWIQRFEDSNSRIYDQLFKNVIVQPMVTAMKPKGFLDALAAHCKSTIAKLTSL